MHFIKNHRWALLSALGFLGHRLVSDWIRPVFGKGHSVLAFVLGVGPNFLGAALVFPFAGMAYWQYWLRKEALGPEPLEERRFFGYAWVASQLLLLVWECGQLGTWLYFDWNDVAAGFVGGFVSILIFYHLSARRADFPAP